LSFCTFSFDHCVVCPSLIYRFWLPPFGIFKLFLITLLAMFLRTTNQKTLQICFLQLFLFLISIPDKKKKKKALKLNLFIKFCTDVSNSFCGDIWVFCHVFSPPYIHTREITGLVLTNETNLSYHWFYCKWNIFFYTSDSDLLTDWLVLNTNLNSISAILWSEQII
jgi:hypothetical protein